MFGRRDAPHGPAGRRVCLTVDLEPDCPPFLWTWRGMAEGLPKLLQLFAEQAVTATFFTTGEAARRFPDAIQALMSAGHELACHGMTHRPFPTLDRLEAAREIEQSAAILRDFGATVGSFRAPYLRFPDAYLDLLESANFTRDSSGAVYKPGSRGAGPASLIRIPASVTSSVLRAPSLLRNPWLLALRDPVVLFVHPWEFVDLTAEPIRFDCRFRTGDVALAKLRGVIALFRTVGARFVRIDEIEPLPIR